DARVGAVVADVVNYLDQGGGAGLGLCQPVDGKQALTVTRVQTGALPIFLVRADVNSAVVRVRASVLEVAEDVESPDLDAEGVTRSEERRVGKECRSRWEKDE